jgi:uncharacterized membrane protein YdjX (TVP38/TMEM64 family)
MSRGAALARVGGARRRCGSLVAVLALSGSLSPERVRDWVDGFGAAGPVVFICLSALLTVALFPGRCWRARAACCSARRSGRRSRSPPPRSGASLAFSLSRWWAHDAVLALPARGSSPSATCSRAAGFLSVLYARIAPGVPYNLVNYAAGLTAIPLRTFAAATALGASPRAVRLHRAGRQPGRPGQPRGDRRRSACWSRWRSAGWCGSERLDLQEDWSSRAGRSAGRP